MMPSAFPKLERDLYFDQTMLAYVSALLVLGLSIPVAIIDFRSQRIPDVFTIGGTALLFFLTLLVQPGDLLLLALRALVGFGVFFILYRLSGRRLGLGDAKYSALIAAGLGFLGWCVAVAAGSASALAYAAVGLRGERLRMDSRIPLGSFLAIGVLVATVGILARPEWFSGF